MSAVTGLGEGEEAGIEVSAGRNNIAERREAGGVLELRAGTNLPEFSNRKMII